MGSVSGEQWVALRWTVTQTYTTQVPLAHLVRCLQNEGAAADTDPIDLLTGAQLPAEAFAVLAEWAPAWAYTEALPPSQITVVQVELRPDS